MKRSVTEHMERMLGVDEFGVIARDEVLRTLMHRAGYRTWLVMTWLCLPIGAALLTFTNGTWFAIGAVLFAQSLVGLLIFDAMRWTSGVHDGMEQLEKHITVSARNARRSIIMRTLIGAVAGVIFQVRAIDSMEVWMIVGNAIAWGGASAFLTYVRLRPYLASTRRTA
jgi:hypothetical protein